MLGAGIGLGAGIPLGSQLGQKLDITNNENNEVIVECDKEYFRPLEVDTLLGDSRKALKDLKWILKL